MNLSKIYSTLIIDIMNYITNSHKQERYIFFLNILYEESRRKMFDSILSHSLSFSFFLVTMKQHDDTGWSGYMWLRLPGIYAGIDTTTSMMSSEPSLVFGTGEHVIRMKEKLARPRSGERLCSNVLVSRFFAISGQRRVHACHATEPEVTEETPGRSCDSYTNTTNRLSFLLLLFFFLFLSRARVCRSIFMDSYENNFSNMLQRLITRNRNLSGDTIVMRYRFFSTWILLMACCATRLKRVDRILIS